MSVSKVGRGTADRVKRLLVRQTFGTRVNEIVPAIGNPRSELFTLKASCFPRSGNREDEIRPAVQLVERSDSMPVAQSVQAPMMVSRGPGSFQVYGSASASVQPRLEVKQALLSHLPTIQAAGSTRASEMLSIVWAELKLDGSITVREQRTIDRDSALVHVIETELHEPTVERAIDAATKWSCRVSDVPESVSLALPLVRTREDGPAAGSLLERTAWTEEKRLLAAAAGGDVTENDIQVISVFKRVPVTSASRIEVGPGPGSLSIFLRPIPANMVQSAKRPTFSIAFGRVKGLKSVVRVLIPEITS